MPVPSTTLLALLLAFACTTTLAIRCLQGETTVSNNRALTVTTPLTYTKCDSSEKYCAIDIQTNYNDRDGATISYYYCANTDQKHPGTNCQKKGLAPQQVNAEYVKSTICCQGDYCNSSKSSQLGVAMLVAVLMAVGRSVC